MLTARGYIPRADLHFFAIIQRLGLAVVSIAALTTLVSPAWAQSATGRLSGTVVDPSGAPIPAASVIVRNDSTGVELKLETNASGGYTAVDLPAVTYTLEVSLDGFQSQALLGVKINVAAETSVPPVTLEIGEVATVVEVVADIGGVQTTNAEVTKTISQDQIDNLPIIGRDPLSLISLQAGVNFNGNSATTINGQRTSSSNVTFDGINIQDNFIRTNSLDFLPNRTTIDQVAEFTLTTQNGNSATSGGSTQVNFVSRSGGPEFHGKVYLHNRNDALSANEWFSNRDGLDKPFLNRNQFGGSFSGPLVKDRLFFYANYEVFKERADGLVNATILTSEARRGLFTYVGNNGRTQKVNVLNMQGLSIHPEIQQILDSIPSADQINNVDVGDSDSGQLRNTAGYRFLANDDSNRDSLLGRFDYVLDGKSQISGTYQVTREDNDRPDAGIGYHADPVVRNFGHTQLVSAGWRWSPGPRWSNELRGGFNLAPGDFRNTDTRRTPDLSGLAFTNPIVNFDNQGRYTDTYNFMNNTSAIRGKHSIRFGVWSQRVTSESFGFGGTRPSFGIGISVDSPFFLTNRNFPGGISSDDLLDAERLMSTLAGVIGNADRSFNVRDRSSGFIENLENRRIYELNGFALYASDNWKVSSRLTVELGLRWDYGGRFNERNGLMLGPVAGPNGLIQTLRHEDAVIDFLGDGTGRPVHNRDLNNFAPNIGIAYDPFGRGRTAIRAGYGIHFVNDEFIGSARNAIDANDGLVGRIADPSVSLFLGDSFDFSAPEFRIPRTASENLALDPTSAIFAIDPNLRVPYVQNWQFSIQHEIASGTVIEARYLGNKATKLIRGFDYNQIDIFSNGYFGDFQRARSNGFLALDAEGAFNPEFDPLIDGSRPLTFFPRLVDEGRLTNSTIQELIRRGEPGGLAGLYLINELTTPATDFRTNINTFPADLVTNFSNSSYHALQLEVSRRVSRGLSYNVNYSFSKVLTDSSGATQVRFDPFLDINSPGIERARADFDTTHVMNGNALWDLPFGQGQRWTRPSIEKWISGWTLGSVLNWQSGAPLSIFSGRGTLNRIPRSGENTANTTLNLDQLRDAISLRMTPDGPFLVPATAISPRDNTGVAPDGEPQFDGQLFTHPAAGELGSLQRNLLNGPSSFTLDLSLNKTTTIRADHTLRLGAKVANILNHPVFFGGSQFLDDEQFGRVTSTIVGARVVEVYAQYSF